MGFRCNFVGNAHVRASTTLSGAVQHDGDGKPETTVSQQRRTGSYPLFLYCPVCIL